MLHSCHGMIGGAVPQAISGQSSSRAAVFAPLDATGKAEAVEQRLSDAIVLGVLSSGERLPTEVELGKYFKVATVTAREALESLRSRGLVQTRRGRGGGSFVRTYSGVQADVLDDRLRATSRVELRDLAAHYTALAAMAAELAVDRSSDDDVETLTALVASADISSVGLARRAENNFRLEVAALSQSARLVNEHVRLQAEFGPLLWLNLRVVENRTHSRQHHVAVVEAIAAGDHDGARRGTIAHLDEALEWLIETKSTLEKEER